jgi:hypothetical protein
MNRPAALPAGSSADHRALLDQLAAKLYNESHYYGNPSFIVRNLAFRQIEELAAIAPSEVYPILLKRLRGESAVWLVALPTLAKESPVKAEHRGKIRLMIEDWLEWGRRHGYPI